MPLASGREHLRPRVTALWTALYISIMVLGVRLLQVQVINNMYYVRAAERSRTNLVRQTAPRGRIYDRKGDVVASNQGVFSLIYLPTKEEDEKYLANLARDLTPLLREDEAELLDMLHTAIREKSPIRLAEKVPLKVFFKLSELRERYDELNLVRESQRFYPNGAFAAHLLGYMGKMDDISWHRLKGQGYQVDSWIGKAGIEKIFERDLRGQDGGMRIEVDARGRLASSDFREIIESKPGSNITLTIDADIQKAAETALRNSPSHTGAVVAIDPRSGAVLALASIPDFDPNIFLAAQNESESNKLSEIPEFNLAIQGMYPPASTFKVIMGAALLNDGKVGPDEKIFCPGYFELGKRVWLCWEPKGHKHQNWIEALTHSCDVYFYRMGLRVGGETIERYEKLFHLGERTHLGLPGEASGRTFGPQGRHQRKLGWYDGDTVNVSIGQGELLVTPIQMAVVLAAMANRGTLWRPYFIQKIEYSDGRQSYQHKPEELGRVDLNPATWDLLQSALISVVREGTGARAQVPGVVIGGKTGTAQTNGKDHSWFVGYAGKPDEPPSLAIAVLAQHGGHSWEAAVPVAKAVIESAFPKPAAPENPGAPAPEATVPLQKPILPQPVH